MNNTYIKIIILFLVMFNCKYGSGQNGFYNVKNFGATGEGKVLETEFLQDAIDKCSDDGGGTVLFPSGTYLTGSIVLKSNITLRIEAGAIIQGSSNKDDYKIIIPKFPSRTNELYVTRSIIYAENAENISIEGMGTIDGNGLSDIYDIKRPQNNRPFIARFVQCNNLNIRNITMLEPANWTCHLLGCSNVLVDGVKLLASHRENRDGLDIDGCQNVTVSNCQIVTGDDAIVLKSTGPAICKNINIINCNVSSQASAIKMGTESTGGFENVTVSNCIITNVKEHSGIALMTVDGGTLKNILFNNIIMDSVKVPFFIRLGDRARPYKNGLPTPETGSVDNICISNVIVTNAKQTSHITGLNKKKITNISFHNISISFTESYKGKPLAYNEIPFNESNYPMGQMYGQDLPASVFFFRNIEGLVLDGIDIQFAGNDIRHALLLDRVSDVRLQNIKVKTISNVPLAYFRNTQICLMENCSNYGNSNYLATVESGNCSKFNINSDKLFIDQKAFSETTQLTDKIYENIAGYASYEFNKDDSIDGLPAYSLNEGSVSISIPTQAQSPFKIMILNKVIKEDEIINVNVNGTDYQLKLSNKTWGWNSVTVEKTYSKEEINLDLQSDRGSKSEVSIAKIVMVPLKVTD
ncbi:MAG: glycoside hydrolase family 28 protein [Bacteroidales bacterium]|nr:glycoside hydrolase family 28 protein [Bacteroidales bacterium]MCF8389560.1 glycoside hydrolase family 28 protein [Bacteroidales bacterium]